MSDDDAPASDLDDKGPCHICGHPTKQRIGRDEYECEDCSYTFDDTMQTRL